MDKKLSIVRISLLLGVFTWWWMLITPMNQLTMRISLWLFLLWVTILLVRWWQIYGNRFIQHYVLIWLGGVLLELIGQTTCIPYSCFSYNDLLWPKLFDSVPVFLLLIRPLIVLGLYQFVAHIRKWWVYLWASMLIYVLFDFFLDPVHVYHGFWSYVDRWRLWVPLQNYLGRAIISLPFAWAIRKYISYLAWDKILLSVIVFLTTLYFTQRIWLVT